MTAAPSEPAKRRSSRRRVLLALGGALLGVALLYLGTRPSSQRGTPSPDHGLDRAAEIVPAASKAVATARRPVARGRSIEAARADVLRIAIVSEETESAVVVDANRIVTATVGQVLLDCLGLEPDGPKRTKLAQTGIDITRDIDRIAITDDAVFVSGRFDSAAEMLAAAPGATRLGTHGLSIEDGHIVLWRGELAIISEADSEIGRRIVDRLEGRAEPGTPLFSAAQAQADIYGSWDADVLIPELMGQSSNIAELAKFAQRITLSAYVNDDVTQMATIELDDGAPSDALADKLRALIRDAGARNRPPAPIDRGLSSVLNGTQVTNLNGGLGVEMALPADFIKRRFRACSFGVRGKAPTGYISQETHADAHWSLPMPPGFVSARDNQDRLLEDWPDYSKILELKESIGDEQDEFVDPVTLQLLRMEHRELAEACKRFAFLRGMLEEAPAPDSTNIFVDVSVGGRTWTRHTTIIESSRSVDYSYCQQDDYWMLTLTLPAGVPSSTIYGRMESLLERATIR